MIAHYESESAASPWLRKVINANAFGMAHVHKNPYGAAG